MLALFALFGAGSRAQAQSSSESAPGSLEARIEAQERQIAELKALLLRQAQELQSQQQAINELRRDQQAGMTAVALPTQAAAEDKRESAHLKVNRAHAPPPTDNPSTEVHSGSGKVKFNGLLQAWYSGGNRTTDTFRLRRTELRFTGELTPEIKWNLMLDPAKLLAINHTFTAIDGTTAVSNIAISQPSRVLQDAFITLEHVPRARVSIGQFKLPLAREALESNAALETVERALFMSDRARGGALGDVRDMGVMINGPLGRIADYWLGLFNGSGEVQNDLDRDDHKTVLGRFVLKPFKSLHLGASGAWSAGRSSPLNPRRDRLGGDLLFRRHRLTLKAEVMAGEDGELSRLGGYGHLGYRFGRFEPVFRFDYFDPDTGAENALVNLTERDYVAGFNYYLHNSNAKLQFNYARKTFAAGIEPSRNVFLANLQTSW